MTRRSGTRRIADAVVVPTNNFGWERALTATLRHSTLAQDERLVLVPLTAVVNTGARDRLSLVAQFAAHQALLRFAGVTDGELDPAEWAVVQKRGTEVRLVRVAARSCNASEAPPMLTIAQQFAELMRTSLNVLKQSWARPDQVYAEVYARLRRDVASDRRWSSGAGCGAVAAPGPEGIESLLSESGVHGYADLGTLESVRRFAALDSSVRLITICGSSPLERYSALAALAVNDELSAAATAESILARTAEGRPLFIVSNLEAFDEGSRQVVDILTRARHGTWLIPGERNALPGTRWFVVAPRIDASRRAVEAWGGDHLQHFVESDAFAAYLSDGDVPAPPCGLPALGEPTRSYLAVLALLGSSVSRTTATRCLSDFLFHGELEELAVDRVMRVDADRVSFVSESVRNEAAGLIPPSSRAAISRIAATHAEGVEAAMLWLDAGDADRAAKVVETAHWSSAEARVAALHKLPLSLLTPVAAARFAAALVDCGRYHDVSDIAASCDDDARELQLARAERRMGEYETALSRLERITASFQGDLLRAELLRLLDREDEAKRILACCEPDGDEQRWALAYERALHGEAVELPDGHYLKLRIETYRALESGDFENALRHATESRDAAHCVTERIDASLDRVFAAFSAGMWDDARILAVEALQEVEETQGDRAAGGILFTLAYLAADEGQWAHATQRIARLRHHYTATADEKRLAELHLLTAHLDFSRGRFEEASRAARAIHERLDHHSQIREAAALILDEIAWMSHGSEPLLSTGRSGNAELTRRHERLRDGNAPAEDTAVHERLRTFRRALHDDDRDTATNLAQEFDLYFDPLPEGGEAELHLLRTAASRDYPFAPHDFSLRWCFATCNRIGHWSVIGSEKAQKELLESSDPPADWFDCGERSRLYFEGSHRWAPEGREALAAIFRTRAENQRLKRMVEQDLEPTPLRAASVEGIVGQSAAIRDLELSLSKVARRDVAVCVLGESGTGKELVARAIHRQSGRRHKAFTAVNCAALPETLVESELFGHVRGAFTGADRDRAGLIESTDGGTLFLDEIGELPLNAQAKLLRFLQEGEFRRVGEVASRSADVRIVSATNRRLDTAVEQGEFRDDLYYRIRGVELTLPPLRERGGDILLLASHFLNEEKNRHQSGASALSPDVEAVFTAYPWPGNVRELQNAIRAAHAMAGDARQIEIEHLPARLRAVVPARAAAGSYQDAVARFKRDLIERSLVQAKGNQNRAAAMLRISRQALSYQIRELGILVRA